MAIAFVVVAGVRSRPADPEARLPQRYRLVDLIEQQQSSTADLRREVAQLRREVEAERQASASRLGGAPEREARLSEVGLIAGLSAVDGPGVKVTLDDSDLDERPKGSTVNDLVIHSQDVQAVVNALWRSGAEAIAINGQRLTATSTIRQAGEAILVDFRPVTSPYEVVALGPEDLAGDFRDGYAGRFFRELVNRYGMSFDTGEVEGVTLGAATELKLRVAVPSAPPPDPSSSGTPPGSTPSEGGR